VLATVPLTLVAGCHGDRLLPLLVAAFDVALRESDALDDELERQGLELEALQLPAPQFPAPQLPAPQLQA
jgi:hypothetical protein